MEQNVNLIGATVFWLYILAALTFTALVLQTISHLPTPKPDRRNSLRVFSGLALVSFATLSYSMLHVLILSYNEWTTRQTLDPFAKTLSLGKIWKWSITSTLFQDFGDAIVENDVRFFWVQSALLATFSVCIHMAMEGRRLHMPRLWVFFALSQILPVSFVQNLFYIAQLRAPSQTSTTAVSSRNLMLRAIALYCACLLGVPYTKGSGYLIHTILLVRLVLLLPLVLSGLRHAAASGSTSSAPTSWQFREGDAQKALAAFAVALSVKQVYLLWQQGTTVTELTNALSSHPAVSALGVDFLLSSASLAIWYYCAFTTGDQKEKSS